MTTTSRTKPSSSQSSSSSVPEFMHAAAIDRFGGPEVLTLHTLPVPKLDKGEVLIEMDTSGVGSWDADMRAGWSPSGHTRFPLVLGTDGAGRVAALGSHIRRFMVGDRVYAYSFDNPKGGFYAEYVAVHEEKVALVPRVLELEEAGAIAATGLTALQGIDDALQVVADEAVIIHGASGAVGTLAVQFARLRRARVLASASGQDGVDLVRRLGAEAAVDGRRVDIATVAKTFAAQGADAVLGLVGGDELENCIDALHPGGRAAYPNGVEPEPRKRPGIRIISYDAIAGMREFNALELAVEAAKLKVPIAGRFSLADASKAHERLERGHVLGRIVLKDRLTPPKH